MWKSIVIQYETLYITWYDLLSIKDYRYSLFYTNELSSKHLDGFSGGVCVISPNVVLPFGKFCNVFCPFGKIYNIFIPFGNVHHNNCLFCSNRISSWYSKLYVSTTKSKLKDGESNGREKWVWLHCFSHLKGVVHNILHNPTPSPLSTF